MSKSKSYLGLVNARPMITAVEVIITAQTVQYQSLPRTVMWLLTVTVLVKPFSFNAPLPIFVDVSRGRIVWLKQERIYQEERGPD